MKLYVFRLPLDMPLQPGRRQEGRPWIVCTLREVFGRHPTHAEAFADAWARTHPKEAPDGR